MVSAGGSFNGSLISGANSNWVTGTYTLTASWSPSISVAPIAATTQFTYTVVTIAPTASFTLVGSATQTTFANDPDTITGTMQNNLAAGYTIAIFGVASLKGAQEAFTTATVTVGAGGSQTFYLSFLGLTPGTLYTVTFYTLSSNGVVVSTTYSTTLSA